MKIGLLAWQVLKFQPIKMRKTLFIVTLKLSLILNWAVFGQDGNAIKYASSIKAADLERHLTYLASDELKGRDTGKEGQKLAAEYLVNFYQEKGLEGPVEGDYLQVFNLSSVLWKEIDLKIGKRNLILNEDFVFIGDANMKRRSKTELV